MSKTNGSLFRRVLRLVRPYRFFIAASLLGAAISVAAQLLVPILCGDAIDAMIGMGRVDFALVAKACLAIAVSTAITAVAQWVLAACNNRIAFRVSQDLRTAAMAKIQRLPLSYLDSHPSGDLVSRIIADVDTFSDGLLMGFTQFFSGVLTIAGTLILMAVIHLGVTAVVVVLTPLSLFAAGFITRRTYRYFKTQSAIRGEQTALVEEMIQGQRVVQAFGYEEKSQAAFDEVNERLKTASIQAVFFSSLTNPVTRFVNSVVYAAVGLTGALLAMGSGISVGQLSVFLSYANQYAKPFNEISGVVTELQNAMACIQRIFDLLDEPDQIPDAPDAIKLVSDGQVAIRDVAFSYTPDRPLLQNLSLDVRPGQRIAIVGPTGCGKTTLINLLMRFYDPQGGVISVDGHDIQHVTRKSLRLSYAMVLQDTWLFNGTIFDNIAYGKPGATMEEVTAAAKAAKIDSYIRKLPDGYQTYLSEDGVNISQGQKQLLTIARAMLLDAHMLILDEATSNVDTRTEILIQKAMDKLMRGRTCFVIAHRLSTIVDADNILVVRDGQIVEQGRHRELLEKKGFYYQLYTSQYAI